MRMFRVIAVGFLLAAPIGAQAQGVPRGMNLAYPVFTHTPKM